MSQNESVFIKKYIEILKFKSIVRNQKVKIINPLKSKGKNSNENKIKLPFIKILKKNESTSSRSHIQTTSVNKTVNNDKNNKDSKSMKDINSIKESKDFVVNFMRSVEDVPKKVIKAISNDAYQRLLNNNKRLELLEKSIVSSEIKEDLKEKEYLKLKEERNRIMIKLPFFNEYKKSI